MNGGPAGSSIPSINIGLGKRLSENDPPPWLVILLTTILIVFSVVFLCLAFKQLHNDSIELKAAKEKAAIAAKAKAANAIIPFSLKTRPDKLD
jgi:hypothetical protein